MIEPRNVARCLPALLLQLLPALLLPLAVSAQPAPNPVCNPGFEQVDGTTGLPTGWAPWSDKSTCAYTLATARTGVASALITDADDRVSQGLRCQRVAVVPGKTYEASGWVKIERATSGFALYLEYWCGDRRVKDVAVSCPEAPEWRLLTVKAEVPPEATAATIIVYSSSANSGSAYFDDIALTEVP